jgi:hypothetical protein
MKAGAGPVSAPPDTEAIFVVIGGKSDLRPVRAAISAEQVKLIGTLQPRAALSLHLDGFEDDPRELWEIPEAALFIRQFAVALESLGLPPRFHERLAPGSIDWHTEHE